MVTLRRFSESDVATLRAMAERGSDDRAIGAVLNRTPQAIRTKAVELGVRLRPPSLDGRRIKLKAGTWAVLEAEGRRFKMQPSKLARLIIETVVADDLLDAVIDPPRSLRRPMKRDPKWAGRLAARQFDVYRSEGDSPM
jgi:hypothetical protein